MYFLWSKGENELHFSIFWEPVICKQEVKKGRLSLLFKARWWNYKLHHQLLLGHHSSKNRLKYIHWILCQQWSYISTGVRFYSLVTQRIKEFDCLHADYHDRHSEDFIPNILPLNVSSSSSFPNTMPRSWTAQVWNCTRNITSRHGLR